MAAQTPGTGSVRPKSSAVPFAVVPMTGRGMGAVALGDHKTGERIFQEKPLFVVSERANVDPPSPSRGGAPRTWRARPQPGPSDIIEGIVTNLPTDVRTKFFALAQSEELYGKTKTAAGVAGTNGIPFVDDGVVHGGLFYVCSRINHSCDANCRFKWNSVFKELTVHATRRIAVGEEITFNYLSVLRPRAQRLAQLRTDFGFECKCAKCSLTGEALDASEARIGFIGEYFALDEELLQATSLRELVKADPATMLGKFDERFLMMRVECGGEDAPLSNYHAVDAYLGRVLDFCDTAAARLAGVVALSKHRPEAKNAIFTDPIDNNKKITVSFEEARDKALQYLEAATKWAAIATETARVLAGEDHPDYKRLSAWVPSVANTVEPAMTPRK